MNRETLKNDWIVFERKKVEDKEVIIKAYLEDDVKDRILNFEKILIDLENLSKREFNNKYGEIIFVDIPKFLLEKYKEIFGDWEK